MSDFSIGRGEKRFNKAVYKSSHNSYSRDESLASQIDDYNVWQIELDLCEAGRDIKVSHDTDPDSISAAPSLSALLNRMVSESETFSQRFTILYLDLKKVESPENFNEKLKGIFTRALTVEHIYPSQSFKDEDGSAWPSWQALVRRNFFWCVIVDWHGERPHNAADDSLFFEATSSNPPDDGAIERFNMVLVSVDGGCDVHTNNEAPQLKDDRWIFRIYPGGGCAFDCKQHNGNYWNNAIANEYNLIASNCVNWDHTFGTPLHCPVPLYVDQSANAECPNGYEQCGWGTKSFPFLNLADAIQRASPMVPILIAPGNYNLRTAGQTYVIAQPLIFRAKKGVVRIS